MSGVWSAEDHHFLNLTIQTTVKSYQPSPNSPNTSKHHHPSTFGASHLWIPQWLPAPAWSKDHVEPQKTHMEPENHLPNLPFLGSMIPYVSFRGE